MSMPLVTDPVHPVAREVFWELIKDRAFIQDRTIKFNTRTVWSLIKRNNVSEACIRSLYDQYCKSFEGVEVDDQYDALRDLQDFWETLSMS